MTSPQRTDWQSGTVHWFRRSLPVFLVKIFTRFKPFGCPTIHENFCRFLLLLMFWRLHFNAKCPHSKLGDEYWWMGVSRLKLNQSWPWNFHIFWCVDSLKERCVCDDISMFLFFKGVESFEKWNLKVQKWYVCIYEYIYIYTVYFSTLFFFGDMKGWEFITNPVGSLFLCGSVLPPASPWPAPFSINTFLTWPQVHDYCAYKFPIRSRWLVQKLLKIANHFEMWHCQRLLLKLLQVFWTLWQIWLMFRPPKPCMG